MKHTLTGANHGTPILVSEDNAMKILMEWLKE